MGKVSRIPTIGDYTIFFNSLFFVLYSEYLHKSTCHIYLTGAAKYRKAKYFYFPGSILSSI